MNAMPNTLIWDRDGRNWPNREASCFVQAAGMKWHVQQMGKGPVLLLLHGTGASTHSWRCLLRLLASRFRVVALDLPGHGFTQAAPREFLSLFGMAVAINQLLEHLKIAPAILLGHSAGAAVATQLSIYGHAAPEVIIGINGALVPRRGIAGHVFSPLATLLNRIPFIPRLFAHRAFDRSIVESMIADTGSKLESQGIDFYWKLAQSPGHIAAAFGMMAEWDLPQLERDLRRLRPPLVLLAATNDRTVPSSEAQRVRAILPKTRIIRLEGLGHLAHEERPQLVADIILDIASSAGTLPEQG
jgi:magnesium chelatase accessory protein